MVDTKNDIITIRGKIYDWTEKMMNITLDNKQILNIFETLDRYKCESHLPLIDTPLYEEIVEGWKLIVYRNKLEEEYPRIYKQVLAEEQKQRREMLKMMKEDDKKKWCL
jgi:hypothetical protein